MFQFDRLDHQAPPNNSALSLSTGCPSNRSVVPSFHVLYGGPSAFDHALADVRTVTDDLVRHVAA